jgi:excisionase family DNA binding protein
VRKEDITVEKTKRKKNYLTTTELAKFCGVSRFTVRNWINRGKIRTIRTVGNQHRIPASEAISFLETMHRKTFHDDKKAVTSGLLGHCWEHTQKTNCDRECGDCLIYGREIDYCFVVVRQFGKEIIRCEGDCLNCSYFERFFSSYSERTQFEEPRDKKSKEANTEEKKSLYSLVYGVGRSVHGIKEKAVSLREKFAGRSSRTNGLR